VSNKAIVELEVAFFFSKPKMIHIHINYNASLAQGVTKKRSGNK